MEKKLQTEMGAQRGDRNQRRVSYEEGRREKGTPSGDTYKDAGRCRH